MSKTKNESIIRKIMARPDSSAIFAVIVLIAVFSIFTKGFLTMENLFNVTRNGALYIIVALGQAIVLVTGGMNISVGAVGGVATITCGILMQNFGWPPLLAVIIALIIGCLCGLINGLIITRIRINAFVTTLATSYVFTGIVYGVSKGFPYAYIPESFTMIGRSGFLGFPILFYIAVVILIFIWLFFKYTMTGRRILATGGNKEAAQLSGIKTDNIIVLVNTISGLFSAIAAVLWVSRMGSATPTAGSDWVMYSFAVAIIGGTALSGGVFSAFGLFCGGIMFTMIKNGLIMLQVNIYYEQTFLGLIILFAVFFESLRQRYAGRIRK